MKRLAVSVILLAVVGVAGCPCIDPPPPPKPVLRIARCASSDACRAGQICDAATQACVDVCGQPCAIDQVSVKTVDGGCACVNTDGLGSPCLTDGDCPSVAGSPTERQLCRAVASPAPGWPVTTVCVAEPSCTVGTSECGDPAASPQVEATCVALVGTPPGPGTCATACVDSAGSVRTECRVDQIPKVAADGTCACVSRVDPFGDPCSSDADCKWVGGPLGDAGPTRTCKAIGGTSICVPTDFCTKEEVTGTCTNGVDDDCDGKPEADEPACLVKQCADRDSDGYCDSGSCTVRKAEAAKGIREKYAAEASKVTTSIRMNQVITEVPDTVANGETTIKTFMDTSSGDIVMDLGELEAETMDHVHLENNVLFPRVMSDPHSA